MTMKFSYLGSARASRAVSGALAGNPLRLKRKSPVIVTPKPFGGGAERGTRGACAPQSSEILR